MALLVVATVLGAHAPSDAATPGPTPRARPAATVAPPEANAAVTWLDVVNGYRTGAGLAPVVAEPAWTDGQLKHLAYLENTPPSYFVTYPSLHTENPASPWYTPEGAAAAAASNIGYGDDDREIIEGWLVAPFHSIGIMRPNLVRAAFARADGRAMLDVIRGLGPTPDPRPVVQFPPPASVTPLRSFGGELPDPREGCAANWRAFEGLPLYALLPTAPPPGTTATLTRPDGSTVAQGPDLCVHTADTYASSDPVYGASGTSILRGANAVLVIPRVSLTDGVHRVTISRPGQADVTWSFTVDGSSTGVAPPTSVSGASYHTVAAGAAGATAVLANLTMVDAPRAGYVSADRCDRLTNGPQSFSSGNHGPQRAVANLAVVPVDGGGSFCVYTQSGPALVVDVQGQFAPGAPLRFTASAPRRVLDTRARGGVLAAGSITRVDSGAPAGAEAVLVNLAMTDGAADGYVTADRCSALTPGPQTRSSGNHPPIQAVSNLSVVPVDADGSFCFYNQTPVHLAADLQGHFSATADLRLTTEPSTRLLDTRAGGAVPPAGTIVRVTTGHSGVTAALVNLTMVDASGPGYITADRCSALAAGPQTKSTGNHGTATAVANLAVVPVDADGSFCVYTQTASHLVVDLQGTLDTAGALGFALRPPTRVYDTR